MTLKRNSSSNVNAQRNVSDEFGGESQSAKQENSVQEKKSSMRLQTLGN